MRHFYHVAASGTKGHRCARGRLRDDNGIAQRWEKVIGYLDHLPEAEAEVIRCIDLKEMTIVETAAVLGRARSTMASQHARASENLAELARASERAEELGRRAGR
ncbi:MAG: sigma factor-like helix-turn-helix DNA-binding protein [Minicystis sp.]